MVKGFSGLSFQVFFKFCEGSTTSNYWFVTKLLVKNIHPFFPSYRPASADEISDPSHGSSVANSPVGFLCDHHLLHCWLGTSERTFPLRLL